jgi:hypothetical protein
MAKSVIIDSSDEGEGQSGQVYQNLLLDNILRCRTVGRTGSERSIVAHIKLENVLF